MPECPLFFLFYAYLRTVFGAKTGMKRFLVLFVVMVLGLQLHAQDIDDVAMMVGNKLVTLDEFVYAYQKNQLHAQGSLDRFLKDFKNRKIKVAYAESLGYDTLTAVRRKLEIVQQNLAQGTPVGGNLRDGALHGQSLYIGHLFLPLPQHAPYSSYQYQLKTRIDSVYREIKAGKDFMTVVNQVSPNTQNEYWISRNHTLAEVERVAYSLREGEMGEPFLATDGYHLLKVFRKADISDIEKSTGTGSTQAGALDQNLLKEYRDGVLLSELYKHRTVNSHPVTEGRLMNYYDDHKKDYQWDIPHYKGVYYHCKDKKTMKKIKKLFNSYPYSKWGELVHDPAYASLFENAKVSEVKLYMLSQDPYIDALVFGGPRQYPVPGYPYLGVSGKKLKKGPENYLDVRDQLLKDIQFEEEEVWMSQMEKKVTVYVNNKALKRIMR